MNDIGELKTILERVENGKVTRLDLERIRMAARAIRGAKVKFDKGQVQLVVFDFVDDYNRSSKQCVERGRDLAKLNSVFEDELRNAFDGVVVDNRNLEELFGALDIEEADLEFLRKHEVKTGTIHVLRRLGFWAAPLSASEAINQVKVGEDADGIDEHKRRVADLRKLLKQRSK